MAHARRKIHDLHVRKATPTTNEALRRIGELYAIEAQIRGLLPDERQRIRQQQARPRAGPQCRGPDQRRRPCRCGQGACPFGHSRRLKSKGNPHSGHATNGPLVARLTTSFSAPTPLSQGVSRRRHDGHCLCLNVGFELGHFGQIRWIDLNGIE